MQTCEMDLHLGYWDVNENLVWSRYYGASFLGHATHTDLLNHFKGITRELPLTNLFQIAMDGLNLNLKFFKEFSAIFNSNCLRSLIDMGTCNLHVVHGSLKTSKVGRKKKESCLWMGSQKKSWKLHTLSCITI